MKLRDKIINAIYLTNLLEQLNTEIIKEVKDKANINNLNDIKELKKIIIDMPEIFAKFELIGFCNQMLKR